MKVDVWDHVLKQLHRAAVLIIAAGIVACTAHTAPSTDLVELPLADLSALALTPGGAPLPDGRTDGNMSIANDPIRVVRLANFDLSDSVPRYTAMPRGLVAPILPLTRLVEFHQHGSEEATVNWAQVQVFKPPGALIRPSFESRDQTVDPLLAYHLDHVFELTEARDPARIAGTGKTHMLAYDALYPVRQPLVESFSGYQSSRPRSLGQLGYIALRLRDRCWHLPTPAPPAR